MEKNPFQSFLGKQIKAPYKDGTYSKIAVGTLEDLDDQFIRVCGNLGRIVINVKNVESMYTFN